MRRWLNRRDFIRTSTLVALPLLGNNRLIGAQSPTTRSQHRILSCNIRVDLPEDEEKGVGWQQRKDICVKVIADKKPDIICLQEVLKGQMEDLMEAFPDFVGFGFEGPEIDANPIGYHGIAKNPVLYSNERYILVSGGVYWLSETPLKAGSISWNSARARHANYIRLKERATGRQFRVINLHLDHKSQQAREEQIKLILAEARQYTDSFPQLLAGDLNASMSNQVYRLIIAEGWTDSYTAIHGDIEPGNTVHLFQGEQYEKKEDRRKIDFIFAKGDTRAMTAEIIRDHVNGRYPSDHYFVAADMELNIT